MRLLCSNVFVSLLVALAIWIFASALMVRRRLFTTLYYRSRGRILYSARGRCSRLTELDSGTWCVTWILCHCFHRAAAPFEVKAVRGVCCCNAIHRRADLQLFCECCGFPPGPIRPCARTLVFRLNFTGFDAGSINCSGTRFFLPPPVV